MRKQGEIEKRRHDQKAREESIEVGTQVLLKSKKKKKGMPKYDPRPFTVTEIVGRQAVLERGSTKLRRETQKFKKYYPKQDHHVEEDQEEDHWESQRVKDKPLEAPQDNTAARESEKPTPDRPRTLPAPETLTADTPWATCDSEETNVTVTEPTEPAAPRRSTRTHIPPNRYGSWTTD